MKQVLLRGFCFLVIFSGCLTSRNAIPVKSQSGINVILPETKFFLDSIIGDSVNSSLPGKNKIYISFDQPGGKFSGFAGCNRYFGEFQIVADTIRFGIIAATKMACPDLESEQNFLESLNEKTFLIEKANTRLILNGENVTIQFVPEHTE